MLPLGMASPEPWPLTVHVPDTSLCSAETCTVIPTALTLQVSHSPGPNFSYVTCSHTISLDLSFLISDEDNANFQKFL